MGIVQLDSYRIREVFPGALRLLETADDIVERSRTPEVLLLQAKLLATLQAVSVSFAGPRERGLHSLIIGIQHCGDGLGALLVCDGALVLA